MLASIFVGMALLAFLRTQVAFTASVLPEKAPAVLADRAAELIRRIGHADPPADSAYGLDRDEAYLSYLDRTDPADRKLDPTRGGYFWYRQSSTPTHTCQRGWSCYAERPTAFGSRYDHRRS